MSPRKPYEPPQHQRDPDPCGWARDAFVGAVSIYAGMDAGEAARRADGHRLVAGEFRRIIRGRVVGELAELVARVAELEALEVGSPLELGELLVAELAQRDAIAKSEARR